jgi:hypothetical protein
LVALPLFQGGHLQKAMRNMRKMLSNCYGNRLRFYFVYAYMETPVVWLPTKT